MSSARQRSPSACRFSAKRSSKSPIRPFATAAPSAAVWSTPIRRRNCRCSPSPWTQLSICAARGRADRLRRRISIRAICLTDIAPDELLIAIDFHLPPADSGWCCTEIARRHGDFAIVAVAVLLGCGRDRMNRLRPRRTWRSRSGAAAHGAAEQALLGEQPGAELFRRASDLAAQAVDPPADIHASSSYRRHLTGVLVRRALATAASRIKGQAS